MYVAACEQEMEIAIPEPPKLFNPPGMVESKSLGTLSPLQKQDSHRGMFVDRGVGSPRLVKSASANTLTTSTKPDSGAKVCKQKLNISGMAPLHLLTLLNI